MSGQSIQFAMHVVATVQLRPRRHSVYRSGEVSDVCLLDRSGIGRAARSPIFCEGALRLDATCCRLGFSHVTGNAQML